MASFPHALFLSEGGRLAAELRSQQDVLRW